jgi:hypothetical protein
MVSEKIFMKKMLGIVLIFFIGLSGTAFGQPANEAIEALQKLSSKCDTGISFRDYTRAVGDTSFAVKSYLDNPESNKNHRLKESIQKAWGHFLMAKDAWNLRFARVGVAVIPELFTSGKGITGQSGQHVMSELIAKYPELSSNDSAGEVVKLY